MIDVVNKSLEMCPFCDFAYFQVVSGVLERFLELKHLYPL